MSPLEADDLLLIQRGDQQYKLKYQDLVEQLKVDVATSDDEPSTAESQA